MPRGNFATWTPEQRAEAQRKAAETRARKKAEGIADVRTEAGKRPPKVAGIATSRTEITRAIETVNLLLVVGGLGKYALSAEEISAEADALYVVCQDTPGLGKLLVRGSRFTAWGKLLWVNYVILVRRRLLPDGGGFVARADIGQRSAPAAPEQASSGPARPDTGAERFGEDDAAAAASGDAA